MKNVHNLSEVEYRFKILSDCCEQFPVCITDCIDNVTIFLEMNLRKAYAVLIGKSAPTEKISAIRCIHEAFRFFLIIHRTCLFGMQLPLSLKECFFELLECDCLPMETLFNCTQCIVSYYISTMSQPECWKVCRNQLLERPDLVKSSLCVSILNTFTGDNLKLIDDVSGVSIFRFLCNIVVEIHTRNCNDSSLILSTSRVIFTISKRLSTREIQAEDQELNFLINFVWEHMDHYIDGVRHLSRDTLINIVKLKDEYLLNKVLQRVSESNRNSKAFIVVLALLVNKMNSEKIIESLPNISENLLVLTNTSVQAASIYKTLMSDNFNTTEFDLWFNCWLKPLFYHKDSIDIKYIEQILHKAVQLTLNVSKHLNDLKSSNELPLKISLIHFKIEKEMQRLNADSFNWINQITVTTMKTALHDNDENTRFIAVNLILDSHKSTQIFMKDELELMKYFITYNVKTEVSSTRQIHLSLVKKLLVRMKESQLSITVRSDETLQISVVENYTHFYIWLLNFCFKNLFFHENFARRTFVLGIFRLIQTCLSPITISEFYSEKNILLLLNCLWDDYEQNKILAKDILKNNTQEKFKMPVGTVADDLLKSVKLLMSSTNPSDCITAGYLLEVMIYLSPENFEEHTFTVISEFMVELKKEIMLAEESITLASAKGPMYGIIHTIRHIINSLNWQTLSNKKHWVMLIEDISNICLKCEKIVSVVVNDSSPEGLVPMDGLCQNDCQVTSQMVLLCCWRTTKEASLMLGDIVGIIALHEQNSDKSEFNNSLIVEICSCLTILLSETKHRGAFEQIFVAYSKVCSVLWKSPKLHYIPLEYLEDVLTEIKSGMNEKFCVTRRSAGMPFIVQALICTNHDKRKVVNYTLETLISVCEVQHETEILKTGVVHALNVLRALFRCSTLGEFVGPFVSRAIIVSIILFNSSSWPVRNSSTLLLSALMTRVFGVPRSSTEVSWKNCMNGRVFFERYPELYDTFLSEFKKFSPTDLRPSLYPTLLILARLFPTSNEATDSVFPLSVYIPYIFKCAQSPVMKTRMLAATSLTPQITINNFVEHINITVNRLLNNHLEENSVHGLLLQMSSLVQNLPNLSQNDLSKLVNLCESILSEFDLFIYSFVTQEVFLRCITYLWIQLDNLQYSCVNSIFMKTLDSIITVFQSNVIGRSKFLESGILFLFSVCTKAKIDFSNVMVKLLSVGVRCETSFVILEMVLDNENPNDICGTLKQIQKHKNWDRKILLEHLMANNSLIELVCKHCSEKGSLTEIKYKVLSNYPPSLDLYFTKYESINDFILRAFTLRQDNELAQALSCIHNQMIKMEPPQSCDWIKLTELLEYVLWSQRYDSCKCVSIDIIVDNYKSILTECLSNIKLLLKLWTMLIRCSEDDSKEVRSRVWRFVDEHAVCTKAFESLFEKFSELFNEYPSAVLTALTCWAYLDIKLPQDRPTEQVFDGGDTCEFKEHMVRQTLALSTLSKLTNNQDECMNLEIENDIHEWIVENWLNIVDVSHTVIKLTTVGDLISYAKDFNSRIISVSEMTYPFQLIAHQNMC
ncbi:thyroid adenoma-associated protein homolog isoform X2 [Adelges cooleyi]|nr:thyroid adenoma-associated protein homolog isoform X2 [Adelges cooleyi]XP_050441277.1 thyroid adenoma-associated protein homolog isoform X2 [Adelges cooleyi]